MTAQIQGDFVVLMLGLRVNRWWRFHRWIPAVLAMPRMLSELKRKPELGLLGVEFYGVLKPVIIQYWRSYDLLEQYARSKKYEHQPAWQAYNRRILASGDVGLWHETYRVTPGQFETIYTNMPQTGLAAASTLVTIGAGTESSRERLNAE